MKGICHIWSRGRHFSPSMPGDRYLKLGSKSDLQAEISLSLLSPFYFHFCHLGTAGWCVDLVLICKHPVVHNLMKSHKTIRAFLVDTGYRQLGVARLIGYTSTYIQRALVKYLLDIPHPNTK